MRSSVGLTTLALLVVAVGAQAASEQPGALGRMLTYEVSEAVSKKPLYTMRGWTEEVEGHPDRVRARSELHFPLGGSIDMRVLFTRDDPPRCISAEASVLDKNGTIVASGQEQIVPAAYPFLTTPLPPNTYPPLAPLGYVLARLGLGRKETESFYMVLMGSSLLQMDLKVEGRETVQVPAGEFDTYRVRMRVNPQSLFPNLPAFTRPFISFFIPTHTFWLTAAEPQELVKFTGMMGPPGSPDLMIELTPSQPIAPEIRQTPP